MLLRRHKSFTVIVDRVILWRIDGREVLRRLLRYVVVVVYHYWLLVTIPARRRSEVSCWLQMRLGVSRIWVAVNVSRLLNGMLLPGF
jgi:hypothetical protein